MKLFVDEKIPDWKELFENNYDLSQDSLNSDIILSPISETINYDISRDDVSFVFAGFTKEDFEFLKGSNMVEIYDNKVIKLKQGVQILKLGRLSIDHGAMDISDTISNNYQRVLIQSNNVIYCSLFFSELQRSIQAESTLELFDTMFNRLLFQAEPADGDITNLKQKEINEVVKLLNFLIELDDAFDLNDFIVMAGESEVPQWVHNLVDSEILVISEDEISLHAQAKKNLLNLKNSSKKFAKISVGD